MTIQAIRFLRKLKNVQIVEDGLVVVDNDKQTIQTVPIEKETVRKQEIRNWNSVAPMLDYLSSVGFVILENKPIVRVTHAGWHYYQSSAVSIRATISLVLSVLSLLISFASIACQ